MTESRFSDGDSGVAATAGRTVLRKFHETVCTPALPDAGRLASVSPATLVMMTRGVPETAAPRRYEMSAPYVGLGTAKNACALPLPLAIRFGAWPHWYAVCGSNRCASAASTVGVSCCNGVMSAIHRLRPCVAAISSWSRGWICRSYTGTVGRPLMKRVQVAPLSMDAYTATDDPTNSRLALVGSSRMTCRKSPGASLGRLLTIDRNVLPPSFVAYRYGVKSL